MKQLFIVAAVLVIILVAYMMYTDKEKFSDKQLNTAWKLKNIIDAGGNYHDYTKQLLNDDIVDAQIYSIDVYNKLKSVSDTGKLQLLDVVKYFDK